MITRYSEPEPELGLLLKKLKLELPAQPPPKITAACAADPAVVPSFRGRLQQTQILRCPKMLESAKLG